MLRRELGAGGPERIRTLVAAGDAAQRRRPPGCQQAIETLEAMAALKPAQHRLAARQLLAPS